MEGATRENAEIFFGPRCEWMAQMVHAYDATWYAPLLKTLSLDPFFHIYWAGLHLSFVGDVPTALRMHAAQYAAVSARLSNTEEALSAMVPNLFFTWAHGPCCPNCVLVSCGARS